MLFSCLQPHALGRQTSERGAFLLFLLFRCILKEKRGNGMTIFLSIFCSSVVCFILMKWHIANIEQRLNEQSQKEEAILTELTNRLSKNFDQTV